MNAVFAGLIAERTWGAALASLLLAADQSRAVPCMYVYRRYVTGLRHSGEDGQRWSGLVAGPSQTERGFMHSSTLLYGPRWWSQLP
jgi:hypothetical protein